MTITQANRGQGSLPAAPAQGAKRRGRPSKHDKVTYTCENCGTLKTVYAHPNRRYRACSRTCNALLARTTTKKYGKRTHNASASRKKATQKNHALSHQNMLQRGKCALHPIYNDGQELHVTIKNVAMFAWDHIDRTLKTANVARLKTRKAETVQNEIDKCQLVCHNCHAMKSMEQNDHRPIDKQTNPQHTLF
jgi:hypothetical protein